MWQNVYFEYYGEHWWYCSDTWLSAKMRELWTIHHVTLNLIYYHWKNMIYWPDLLKWCVPPLSTVHGLIPAINHLSAVSVNKWKPNQGPVPLRLFSNVMTLHLHNVNVNKMSTLLKLRPTNTGDIVMTFSLGNQCIQTFHWMRLFSHILLL